MTSAPRPYLLAFDAYRIVAERQPDSALVTFVVYDDEQFVARTDDVQLAITSLFEHFKDKRSSILERVKDPELKINLSIR